jgi:hypothetical protein
MSPGHRAFRFYSPTLDAEAVRLSMADEAGREYYMIVAADEAGRRWRERKEEALAAIDDAIARGDGAGEVYV